MSTGVTAAAMPDADDLRDLRDLAGSIFDKATSEALTVQQTSVPYDDGLWTTLAASGLTLLTTSVSAGGGGAGLAEAVVLLSVSGEYAAPGPIAEHDLLAAWLLDSAHLEIPSGPLTSADDVRYRSRPEPRETSLSPALWNVCPGRGAVLRSRSSGAARAARSCCSFRWNAAAF